MAQQTVISRSDHSSQSLLPSRPSRLVLELSRNCNLHCIMCGFGGNPIRSEWFMHQGILDQFIHPSPELSDFLSEITEIRLNGRGESTIHPHFASILETIVKTYPRARLSLFTNLMVPNKDILDLLLQYKVELYISIDSVDPVKYETIRRGANFSRLIQHLRHLHNAFLVFTLQQSNLLEIETVGKFAAESNMGVIINILRTDDPTYQSEFNKLLDQHWTELLRQLQTLHFYLPHDRSLIPDQIWNREVPTEIATTVSCGRLPLCPNIQQEIMIGFDGIVYPCNMFNPEIIGDLNFSSLPVIWQSPQHQAFLSHHKQCRYCQHCEYMIPRRI